MTIEQAKKEMGYYSEEEYGKGSLVAESHKMAIKAFEIQEKLQDMVKTLEQNLSSPNIDFLDEYEQCKYDAHYKCLSHLKKILENR